MKDQQLKRNWLIERAEEYHNSSPTAVPTVSDGEWDIKWHEYIEEYPEDIEIHKLVMDNSNSDRMEPIPIPMFSLDKIKNIEVLYDWISTIHEKYGNQKFVLSAKFDGISLVTKDNEGLAWTRGDGTEGMRSHDHYRSLKLPFFTDIKGIDYTFGEALPTKRAFTELISPEPYASGRSFASSMFRTDHVKESEIKSLSYMRYGIGGEVGEDMDKTAQLFTLDKLNIVKMMEPSNPLAIHIDSSEILDTESNDFLAKLDALYNHFNKTFECDGIVFDVNDAKIRKELGRNSKNNPVYAKAFKLAKWNERKNTKITGYDFNISKQGLLKGTVTFVPVMIGGCEIKQATFYNASFISDFCLVPGANITICKSGDVIPKIVAVEGIEIPMKEDYPKRAKEFKAALEKASEAIQEIHGNFATDDLMECPSCGSILKWNDTMVDLVCNHNDCEGMRKSKLEYFSNKLEIDGIDSKGIEKFFNFGYSSPERFFHVGRHDIYTQYGWGATFANKVVGQFEKIKEDGLPLAKWIKALDLTEGIVGEENIQKMLNHLINNMGYDFQESTVSSHFIDGLQTIEGIGHRSASSFLCALEAFNVDFDWCKVSYYTEEEPGQSNDDFASEKICFSGCRASELMKSIIGEGGGKVVGSVSSKTTTLVVKDKSEKTLSSGKAVKAVEEGVLILTFDEFKEKYNVR